MRGYPAAKCNEEMGNGKWVEIAEVEIENDFNKISGKTWKGEP